MANQKWDSTPKGTPDANKLGSQTKAVTSYQPACSYLHMGLQPSWSIWSWAVGGTSVHSYLNFFDEFVTFYIQLKMKLQLMRRI